MVHFSLVPRPQVGNAFWIVQIDLMDDCLVFRLFDYDENYYFVANNFVDLIVLWCYSVLMPPLHLSDFAQYVPFDFELVDRVSMASKKMR